jgi:tRNA(His) guanylyltransferase
MVKTTGDLVKKFCCSTGYTSSDEISLVFNAANFSNTDISSSVKNSSKPIDIHPYNGRIQKLASVTAGFASARFNYHLNHPPDQWKDMPLQLQDRMADSMAYFDSRVVPCKTNTLIMETIFWRSNFDAFRNAISQISIANFSHKVYFGLDGSIFMEYL